MAMRVHQPGHQDRIAEVHRMGVALPPLADVGDAALLDRDGAVLDGRLGDRKDPARVVTRHAFACVREPWTEGSYRSPSRMPSSRVIWRGHATLATCSSV